jgi:phage terminase large subunit-like protein
MSPVSPQPNELSELSGYLTSQELDELDRLLAVWTPEPHQIPPDGTWFLWVLLAGRGSGKTDALAHYVNEHVLGPPCHPHLQGGHRIAIIAPTQGDAIESCIDGPSGLRKHNPAVWLSQSRGGTHVYWPGGASAKLFGASSPEDVERLRAGGNRCFVAGTLVETEHGPRPIESIRVGERVWTRAGLRSVTWSGSTGKHPIWNLETQTGRRLLATPDHKFLTTTGNWVALSGLTNATLYAWVGGFRNRRRVRAAAPRSPLGPRVQPRLARERVQRVWPTGVVAPVYELTVDGEHEFFANGLVASNCLVWAEELAAWRKLKESWDNMELGLRMGRHPHVVASTTPKPRKHLIELLAFSDTVRTHATTADNPHLDEATRQRFYKRYIGTRLGRQELEGQMLEDVPGALWKRTRIDDLRVWEAPPLRRIVVAVDPSGGEGPENDEQGIAVCGVGFDDHGYMLDDVSCKLSPEGWAAVAVKAYYDHQANYIVAEKNYGGDMVAATIRSVDKNVPVKLVNASRGKDVRAEPVASLDAQGRIHQVGEWPEMEDELCTWDPNEGGLSPNRLDARVWGFTEVMLGGGRTFSAAVGGERGPVHPPGRNGNGAVPRNGVSVA